jgi:murein L,D-transpeptidase YcbB/YkuD
MIKRLTLSRHSVQRSASRLVVGAALLAALPLPALAAAGAPPGPLESELRQPGATELLPFYASRGYRLLWTTPAGEIDPAANALVQLIENASYDSVDPRLFDRSAMLAAIAGVGASATPAARARAESVLSRTLVAYVRAMRKVPAAAMDYEHVSLRPGVPTPADVLRDASQAPSLGEYIAGMQWMHSLYAPLRQALASGQIADPGDRERILANLQRIRALPAAPRGRYVLVDTAGARLWMYEQGRPVDSMRVVVGKPDQQTPMMSGYIRHAVLDPYWNVPPDLVKNKLAPNVLKRGVGYLKTTRYQVLSDWTEQAQVLDPATVDWKAVAAGSVELRMRQLPSPGNAMGKVKFEFPNKYGIYLHDTPDKGLMLKDARQFSSGCVRLEDAQRLGRWLFGSPLPGSSAAAEQKVELPVIVPVYITYLTAQPDGGRIALGRDAYDRDITSGVALVNQGVAADQLEGSAK